MTSTRAWQRHGCYKLGSDQYFNMPLEKALIGCHDDWNSLDHFDPTTPTRRIVSHFNHLRTVYPVLQDGLNLVQLGNWTYFAQLPGPNHTQTELGWWSVSRAGIPNIQNFQGNHTDQIWLIYTNENVTQSYQFNCSGPLWISSPYASGTTVRNLIAPFEIYQLQDSQSSVFNNSQAPWTGCLPQLTLDAYSFKALVPLESWVPPLPMMTKFSPGHDQRILAEAGDPNATDINIAFEFNVEMNCDSVTNGLSFQMSSSGKGSNPTFDPNRVKCGAVLDPDPVKISGAEISAWSWSVTLNNVPDGILELTLTNIATQDGTAMTGVCISSFHRMFLLIIRGELDN
jgi:alpha-1,3-glucan synthase